MRWHIIRAFIDVAKERVPVGDQSRKITFEVASNLGIGVFANDQRGAGMMNKYVT